MMKTCKRFSLTKSEVRISGVPDSPHVSTAGQWVLTKSEDVTAPPNAQGASIRLGIVKSDAGGEFAAYFDDAFLPEPGLLLQLASGLLGLVVLDKRRRRGNC
jgi:hypothetical protein